MDNNTRLENIIDQTLTAANDIVSTDGWGSLEEISALSDLLNAAKIANDLKFSLGTAVNFDMSGITEVNSLPAPDFGGHGMRL